MVEALVACGYVASGIDPWAATRGLAPPRFTTGQAEAIPLADGSVAAACSFDVLEHADDALALRELHRILAPRWPAVRQRSRPRLALERARYARRTWSALTARTCVARWNLQGSRSNASSAVVPAAAAVRRCAHVDSAAWRSQYDDRRPPLACVECSAAGGQPALCEVALGRWWRPPTGSSLVLVARKQAEPLCLGR